MDKKEKTEEDSKDNCFPFKKEDDKRRLIRRATKGKRKGLARRIFSVINFFFDKERIGAHSFLLFFFICQLQLAKKNEEEMNKRRL